jgi:hypothetical protein
MATGSRSPASTVPSSIHSYRMHVSQKYLELTRQKLELTRLPREPQATQQAQGLDYGVTKSSLEALIDHWVEVYDWRSEEGKLNDELPQYRALVNGKRLHFVHRRSHVRNAIPLLFVHGFPESFITVGPLLEALCAPTATPSARNENVPAFHVVAPSVPGFGFSDALPEEGNSIPATAAMLDRLMKGLGYVRYVVHGSGWYVCHLVLSTESGGCPCYCHCYIQQHGETRERGCVLHIG